MCFKQLTHFNNEQSNLVTFITVNSSSPLATYFNVTVSSTDQSARGEYLIAKLITIRKIMIHAGGDDYNSGPYVLLFPTGVTSVSFNITVYNDNIFEDNETFVLAIDPFSLPNRISLVPNCALVVTIVDNDCKLFYVCESNITFLL